MSGVIDEYRHTVENMAANIELLKEQIKHPANQVNRAPYQLPLDLSVSTVNTALQNSFLVHKHSFLVSAADITICYG